MQLPFLIWYIRNAIWPNTPDKSHGTKSVYIAEKAAVPHTRERKGSMNTAQGSHVCRLLALLFAGSLSYGLVTTPATWSPQHVPFSHLLFSYTWLLGTGHLGYISGNRTNVLSGHVRSGPGHGNEVQKGVPIESRPEPEGNLDVRSFTRT